MNKSFKVRRPSSCKADFYQTPPSMVRHLLDREDFPGPILEPCCGDGALVDVLLDRGRLVCAYDLHRGDVRMDFLTEHRSFPSIITNPPYSLADEFLLKAFDIAEHRVAFLLPLDYLHGQQRHRSVFTVRRPARVYVFVRRPFLSEELLDPYPTGSITFAWFVFDMHFGRIRSTEIEWIDNSGDVLRGTAATPVGIQHELFREG